MMIEIDPEIGKVLEFMQREVPTCKLLWVAEAMPSLARILWAKYDFNTARDSIAEISRPPIG